MGGFPYITSCNKGPLLTPPPRVSPRARTSLSLTTNVSKTITEATEADLILFQLACQVAFHPD